MRRLLQLLRFGLTLCALAALPWLGTPQPARGAQGEETKIKITQVDTSQFPKIKVYVSVTNAAGEPLAVSASQLQLTENGQSVKTETVSGEGEVGPLTTLLIVDVSGSMNEGGKLTAAKSAAQAYVDQMRPGDQAGLVTFNTQVKYVQEVTSDHAALSQAIANLKAFNDTAMFDAVAKGEVILATLPGRKAMIVLTDGLDNTSRYTAEEVFQGIGPTGLTISTIGLGDPTKLGVSNAGLDEAALKSMAERAGGVYSYTNDPDSLRSLYELYGRALQSEYVLTYISSATLRDGVNRSLNVSLGEAGAGGQAVYNPGGVLPEVAKPSAGLLFGSLLLVLLALLVAPMMIQRGVAAGGSLPGMWSRVREFGVSKFGKKKTSRIKLREESQPPAQPRVKLR